MTQAIKTQKQVNVIERSVLSTGVVLYKVLSSDEKTEYYVTISANEVYCECEGFNGKYHKCYHTRELVAAESEREAERKMQAYRQECEARETRAANVRYMYSEW